MFLIRNHRQRTNASSFMIAQSSSKQQAIDWS